MKTEAFDKVVHEANMIRIAFGDNFLGTEHFLLACLRIPNNAGRILKNLGIDDADILKEIKGDTSGGENAQRQSN